jgi:putative DNA primase/helicase
MLRGARLVTASETEKGRPWAESRIKQLTGGDPITARFMRQDFFTYRPQFKLLIIGNHRPVLRTVDEAARRRFAIVPFTRKPEVPDLELEQKLKAEWPGILRWAIDGFLEWQRNGLGRPEIVLEETASYFESQDLIGQRLEDECQLAPGKAFKWEKTQDLFNSCLEIGATVAAGNQRKTAVEGMRAVLRLVLGHPQASPAPFARRRDGRAFEGRELASGYVFPFDRSVPASGRLATAIEIIGCQIWSAASGNPP